MTTTPAIPLDPAADDSWRGVASEDSSEITVDVGIKLQARSRRLLGSLLRPHRAMALLTTVVVVISELAFLVGPLIVAYGIDTAVPALANGDGGPLTLTALAYLGAGVLNALTKAVFIRLSARIAQAVMLDLRGRLFDHSQALSLSFHEKYTSGRVISRMTSDLDTLSDLFDQGLDGLVSGLMSVFAISVALLFLDLPLGLIALAAFIPILLLTRWFQNTSRVIYRRTRAAIASLIVQFTETMNGLRAVLTFRRESRNEAIFAAFNDENAEANGDGLIALAKYTPAVRLVGNLTLAAVMIVGAVQVIDGGLQIGVLAAFLLYVRRMYDPLDELAMFYNSYQSAAAALEKLSGLLEEVPSVPSPATRSRYRLSMVVSPSNRFGSPTTRRWRCSPPSTSSCPPARRWPWSARPGPASRPWPNCWRASTTRHPGGYCWTTSTSRVCRPRICAAVSSWSPRSHSCSPGRLPTTLR